MNEYICIYISIKKLHKNYCALCVHMYLLTLTVTVLRTKLPFHKTNQISLRSTPLRGKKSIILVIILFPRPLKIQELSSLIRIPQHYSTPMTVYVEESFALTPLEDLPRQIVKYHKGLANLAFRMVTDTAFYSIRG